MQQLAQGCGQVALIPNDSTKAAVNTLYLTNAMARGQRVVWPAGNVYIATVTTPATVGCGRWDFQTAGGYVIEPTPYYGQIGTRIICQSGPALRICGAGFIINGPVEFVGDGTSTAIEVEGRSDPATGRHIFKGVLFRDWGCAIHALATPSEAHADNSRVYDCETANVGTVFRSDNQQAVNWYFGGLVVNSLDGPADQLVCDIQRGGLVTIERLICCHHRVTVFQIADFSPNNSRLICRDLEFDRFDVLDAYLTALKYDGPADPEEWRHWFVDVDGFAAMTLDPDLFVDAPESFNLTDINVTIRTLW